MYADVETRELDSEDTEPEDIEITATGFCLRGTESDEIIPEFDEAESSQEELDNTTPMFDKPPYNQGDNDSEDENSEDKGPKYESNVSDPLYPGASITVSVTMTLLLAFIVCHKLTNEAISDLLYIVDYICPKPNKSCKTLYNFKKFFPF